MTQKTPLHARHLALGARMVPFAGWQMPLHYGSQLSEHLAVRRDAGLFDVSHMRLIDLSGRDARPFLQKLLANDVARLKRPGKALYSCMLNPQGGVLDDLICYFVAKDAYRLVVNAASADRDLGWMTRQADGYRLELTSRRELAMIAVQGPNACAKALPLLPPGLSEAAGLAPFHGIGQGDWFVARTGYTGEDGLEIMLPQSQVEGLWERLLQAEITPCGLGARDSLRLEAGMNLYGNDMDEGISPLECGLAWTVAWQPEERTFIGREALQRIADAPQRRHFTGLLLEAKGVLRQGMALFSGERPVGEITSGGFSPSLQRSIAMARVSADAGEQIQVDLRGKRLPLRRVKLPFLRNGKAMFDF
ncbi:glycine cleavage system aminomethyltransferase GcvT [Magnetovirga frankeli]|uniref:glycine cleavage system aminomethyltransferase GcvT n=1 Tax=Magnetovirga frankeli TaxID=947516 RepID=UPI0012935A38|nr:glycine cleavage system aminomethyltransferase GcvT [gamma proteobacterium SS-5]